MPQGNFFQATPSPALVDTLYNAELINELKKAQISLTHKDIVNLNQLLIKFDPYSEPLRTTREEIGKLIPFLMINSVCEEYDKNKAFLEFLKPEQGASFAHQELCKFLLPIKKSNSYEHIFTLNEVTTLCQLFETSTSRTHFLEELNLCFPTKLPPTFEHHLSIDKYNELKRACDCYNTFDRALFNDKSLALEPDFISVEKQINEIKNSTHKAGKNLIKIKKVDNISWLDPCYQAIAKQNIARLSRYYKSIDAECVRRVNLLEKLQITLVTLMQCYPNEDYIQRWFTTPRAVSNAKSFTRQLNKDKAKVDKLLNYISQELKLYQRLHKTLLGDPTGALTLQREGLIGALDKSDQCPEEIQLNNTTIYVEELPLSTKDSYLQTSTPLTISYQNKIKSEPAYEGIEIGEGKFRKYSINYQLTLYHPDPLQGTFLEVKDANAKTYQGSIQLILNTIPGQQDFIIQYYMTVALRMLSLYPNPTPENKLIIAGGRPRTALGLWTALLILGKEQGFDENSIQVDTPGFKTPHHHITSLVGKFSYVGDYLSMDVFKANPFVKSTVKCLKELNKGREKSDLQYQKEIQTATDVFKSFNLQPPSTPRVEEELSSPRKING